MLSTRFTLGGVALWTAILSTALFGQSTHATASTPALEFPVVMRQKVEAGKTPVGSKIQANLTAATLVNGVVIPQDAVLSGEVIASAAKTGTEPSRLAIRLDSAKWKNGSVPATLALTSKIYLTAWYYPMAPLASREFPDALPDVPPSVRQRRGTSSPYPDPNTGDSPTYSRANTERGKNPAPEAPSKVVPQHRELIKNVESTRSGEGVVALTSTRSNIKLDKSTTYVFAAGDLGARSRVP